MTTQSSDLPKPGTKVYAFCPLSKVDPTEPEDLGEEAFVVIDEDTFDDKSVYVQSLKTPKYKRPVSHDNIKTTPWTAEERSGLIEKYRRELGFIAGDEVWYYDLHRVDPRPWSAVIGLVDTSGSMNSYHLQNKDGHYICEVFEPGLLKLKSAGEFTPQEKRVLWDKHRDPKMDVTGSSFLPEGI